MKGQQVTWALGNTNPSKAPLMRINFIFILVKGLNIMVQKVK